MGGSKDVTSLLWIQAAWPQEITAHHGYWKKKASAGGSRQKLETEEEQDGAIGTQEGESLSWEPGLGQQKGHAGWRRTPWATEGSFCRSFRGWQHRWQVTLKTQAWYLSHPLCVLPPVVGDTHTSLLKSSRLPSIVVTEEPKVFVCTQFKEEQEWNLSSGDLALHPEAKPLWGQGVAEAADPLWTWKVRPLGLVHLPPPPPPRKSQPILKSEHNTCKALGESAHQVRAP